MNLDEVFAVATVVALAVYLAYALLRPERFS